MQFRPGIYTDSSLLNNVTDSVVCRHPIVVFAPGVHYFDFACPVKPQNCIWTVSDGWVVGGTLRSDLNLVAGQQPTQSQSMPGWCVSPVPPSTPPPAGWTPPSAGKGVEFVFGGSSSLQVSGPVQAAHVELCGSYSTTNPPIAIYGPTANITGAGNTVHAGCNGCTVLLNSLFNNDDFWVQGTTYLPRGAVSISEVRNGGQGFMGGVVAKSFSFTARFDSGSNEIGPVSSIPSGLVLGLTMVNLQVYVCPGTSACPATGSPALKARVGIGDPTGVAVEGKRQVTVYSWSVQRT